VTPLVPDRLAQLAALTLDHGSHSSFEAGHCSTEVVAYLAGEPHTDRPECLSPVLGAFLRRWNDDLDDEGRQKLKPFLPRVIGTADDGQDEARAWLVTDWLVRVYTPAWLELAGVTESAAALRALPPFASAGAARANQATVDAARKRGAAAWDAAWAAAWDAAWDAARDAAWDAARAAARDAAWDAAWDAARDAAWDAARDAARAAARDAARDAARAALDPTKQSLQASALDLLERMIDPGSA